MSSLFIELKRRNVLRVAAAYTVVGWVVLQAVDVVAPILELPDWFARGILVLLAVGLPITIIVSWFYEWTPGGIMTAAAADAAGYVKPSAFGRQIDFVIIALMAVAIGWLIYEREAPDEAPEASIAVLPFSDLSPEGDQEYFSDGISEELLNVLAKIPDLRVAARTSSFQFKGESRDIQDIARQLNVALVLEGSVRKSGRQIRITAQLIDARSGFHLWSETYDRKLDDIFAVQDEISAAIVGALRDRLGLEVEAAPRVVVAANIQAYESYLLGVHQMEKRGAGPLAEAAAHFERAIEIDPDYAPALARLGMTYLLLAAYDFENYPQGATHQKALALIDRALALAPDLPESQAAKGLFHLQQRDLAAAEPYFRRAIELNPSYATVYSWLGILTGATLRFDEELAWREKSVQVDPLSPLALTNLIEAYIIRNMTGEAEALLPRLKQLSPLFYEGRSVQMARRQGRLADATVSLLKMLSIDPNFFSARIGFAFTLSDAFGLYRDEIRVWGFPAAAHIALGETEEALATADAGLKYDPDNVGPLGWASRVYAAAGERQAARDSLERAWQKIPDGPGKTVALGLEAQLVLIALRLDAGDDAGAKAVMEPIWRLAEKLDAAGIDDYGQHHWARGFLHLFEGREEEGKAALARALEENYIPGILDMHLFDRFPAVDVTALLADYRARMAVERDKFLAIVCGPGNPAPEIWTPLPETCAGAVTGQ